MIQADRMVQESEKGLKRKMKLVIQAVRRVKESDRG